jgi:hypothetical protein
VYRLTYGLLVAMASGLYVWVAIVGGPALASAERVSAEPQVGPVGPVGPVGATWAGERTGLPRPTVGVTLNLWHLDDATRLTAAIDRIAELGFNTVQVVTPVFQRDGAAAGVERIVQPGMGPTDDTLGVALAHARRRGLATSLMMQVNFTHPRGNEWRGKLLPPDWSAWWSSYRRHLVEHAELADRHGATAFSVGCELLTTQQPRQAGAWRETIALARDRFGGRLYYSTNWDAYASFPAWAELDVIGISGYWDLTTASADRDAPTDAELRVRWREVQAGLTAFADRLDRPLVVTEVGYPALPWALRDPWNYLLGDASLDADLQARAYRALADAWRPVLDRHRPATPSPTEPDPTEPDPARLHGLILYEWDLYHDPDTHTGYAIDRPATLDALAPLLSPSAASSADTP